MLTKGAIGNLLNRYKAVLKKCNLINTFGSLAVASMLVLGGAGVAESAPKIELESTDGVNFDATEANNLFISGATVELQSLQANGIDAYTTPYKTEKITINADKLGNSALQVYDSTNTKYVPHRISGDTTLTINTVSFEVNADSGQKAIQVEAASNLRGVAQCNLIVNADEDITVTTNECGTGIYVDNGKLTFTAKTINIKHKLDSEQIQNGALFGIRYKSALELSAQDITINGEKFPRVIDIAHKSQFDFNGNVSITAQDNGIAIYTRGHSTINIGQNTDKDEIVSIKGDIVFNWKHDSAINFENKYQNLEDNFYAEPSKKTVYEPADSNVNITLTGKDSKWDGDPRLYWTQGSSTKSYLDTSLDVESFILTVTDGAYWIPTKDTEYSGADFTSDYNVKVDVLHEAREEEKRWKTIPLPQLILSNGGNVVINPQTDIAVKHLKGEGNINIVDTANDNKLGTFTVLYQTEAALNTQAANADGTAKNADGVTPARLARLQKQVRDVNGNVIPTTASAPRGKVMDYFVLDRYGNIISGGDVSTITKSVLELASVNTVALDKVLTNDVRKRMGDLRSDKNQTGVWMRWDGGRLKGNAGLTNDFNTIQIGGDTKVGKNCRLGVAASFTHGDSEFDRGSSQLEGFSFAGYTTWMGENGMFADIVARIGHFSTDMSVEGDKGDIDSRVSSLSGEYGWRFSVCDQFFIEPQVELAYTYVSSDDIRLGDARFSFDSVDSLTGRAGLVAGWNLPDDMGNVYARASVLQQFMGDAKVTGFSGIGPTVHKTDGEDTWLEYGVGANIKLNDKTYIWADIERTEGAKVEEEWRGTVGIRYSF